MFQASARTSSDSGLREFLSSLDEAIANLHDCERDSNRRGRQRHSSMEIDTGAVSTDTSVHPPTGEWRLTHFDVAGPSTEEEYHARSRELQHGRAVYVAQEYVQRATHCTLRHLEWYRGSIVQFDRSRRQALVLLHRAAPVARSFLGPLQQMEEGMGHTGKPKPTFPDDHDRSSEDNSGPRLHPIHFNHSEILHKDSPGYTKAHGERHSPAWIDELLVYVSSAADARRHAARLASAFRTLTLVEAQHKRITAAFKFMEHQSQTKPVRLGECEFELAKRMALAGCSRSLAGSPIDIPSVLDTCRTEINEDFAIVQALSELEIFARELRSEITLSAAATSAVALFIKPLNSDFVVTRKPGADSAPRRSAIDPQRAVQDRHSALMSAVAAEAMAAVATMTAQLQDMTLFLRPTHTKAVAPSQYATQQRNSIMQVFRRVRDDWCTRLGGQLRQLLSQEHACPSILDCRGTWKQYEVSPLRRLNRTITYRVGYAMRDFAWQRMDALVGDLERSLGESVRNQHLRAHQQHLRVVTPLRIEVYASESGEIKTSPPLCDVADAFELILSCLQEELRKFSSVEVPLIEAMRGAPFWPEGQPLLLQQGADRAGEALCQRLHLANAMLQDKLRQNMTLYSVKARILTEDMAQYGDKWGRQNVTRDDLIRELQRLQHAHVAEAAAEPSVVLVGPVAVYDTRLRTSIIKSYKDHIAIVEKVLNKSAGDSLRAIIAACRELSRGLQFSLIDEAAVSRGRQITKFTRDSLDTLQERLRKSIYELDQLHECNVSVPDELISRRWIAYGWPVKIRATICKVDECIATEAAKLFGCIETEAHDLINNRKTYEKDITQLYENITSQTLFRAQDRITGLLRSTQDLKELEQSLYHRCTLLGYNGKLPNIDVTQLELPLLKLNDVISTVTEWKSLERVIRHSALCDIDTDQFLEQLAECESRAKRLMGTTGISVGKRKKINELLSDTAHEIERLRQESNNFDILRSCGSKSWTNRHWTDMAAACGVSLESVADPGKLSLDAVHKMFDWSSADVISALRRMTARAQREFEVSHRIVTICRDFVSGAVSLSTGSPPGDATRKVLEHQLSAISQLHWGVQDDSLTQALRALEETFRCIMYFFDQVRDLCSFDAEIQPAVRDTSRRQMFGSVGQEYEAAWQVWRRADDVLREALQRAAENIHAAPDAMQTIGYLKTITETKCEVSHLLSEALGHFERATHALRTSLRAAIADCPRLAFLLHEDLVAMLACSPVSDEFTRLSALCFPFVQSIEFGSDEVRAVRVHSRGGEVLMVQPALEYSSCPSSSAALRALDMDIRHTTALCITDALRSFEECQGSLGEAMSMLLTFPLQSVVIALFCCWTKATEQALGEGSLSGFRRDFGDWCTQLVSQVHTSAASSGARMKALRISQAATAWRDMLSKLTQQNVDSACAASWLSTVRYRKASVKPDGSNHLWCGAADVAAANSDASTEAVVYLSCGPDVEVQYGNEFVGESALDFVYFLAYQGEQARVGVYSAVGRSTRPAAVIGTYAVTDRNLTAAAASAGRAFLTKTFVSSQKDLREFESIGGIQAIFDGAVALGAVLCMCVGGDAEAGGALQVLREVDERIRRIAVLPAQADDMRAIQDILHPARACSTCICTEHSTWNAIVVQGEGTRALREAYREVTLVAPDVAVVSALVLESAGVPRAQELASKITTVLRAKAHPYDSVEQSLIARRVIERVVLDREEHSPGRGVEGQAIALALQEELRGVAAPTPGLANDELDEAIRRVFSCTKVE